MVWKSEENKASTAVFYIYRDIELWITLLPVFRQFDKFRFAVVVCVGGARLALQGRSCIRSHDHRCCLPCNSRTQQIFYHYGAVLPGNLAKQSREFRFLVR